MDYIRKGFFPWIRNAFLSMNQWSQVLSQCQGDKYFACIIRSSMNSHLCSCVSFLLFLCWSFVLPDFGVWCLTVIGPRHFGESSKINCIKRPSLCASSTFFLYCSWNVNMAVPFYKTWYSVFISLIKLIISVWNMFAYMQKVLQSMRKAWVSVTMQSTPNTSKSWLGLQQVLYLQPRSFLTTAYCSLHG